MREVCESLICGGGSSSSSSSSKSTNMEVFHGGATAGGGSSEVRKLNLVYFLCRDGQLEHPHLIRVHHFYRHGVHLYDVKRWLADLRGKDMPDSYTWSYKRKYKNGYVWQDLMDDDLITPIADNEYVIKGSLLLPSFNTSLDKSKEVGEVAEVAAPVKSPPEILQIEHENHAISQKPPPQLEQDLPGHTSILEDRREKPATVFRPEFTDLIEERKEGQEPFLHPGNHAKKKMTLWSFLSCREVETDVPSAKPVNRRVAGGEPWEEHDNGGRRSTMKEEGEKAVLLSTSSYRLISEPNCSQCGKSFKPEKLHSHMKSCKAMKGHRRSISNIEKLPLRTESYNEEFSKEAITSYLLTH